MIEVLVPQNALLRQFVDSIYVLKKGTDAIEFTAYPTLNTPVGLFRNVEMEVEQEYIYLRNSDAANHISMACNQFSGLLHLQYLQLVDEIAINFKPLGFSTFTRSKPPQEKLLCFPEWDMLLPDLFESVFATQHLALQLQHIELFLLEQYVPVDDETILLEALNLLNNTTNDYKIQEIAAVLGVHYKQLYRSFRENVGCSPAHYRKLVKFRSSVVSKINGSDKSRLVDICYDNDYTDQPYFTKQFKALTGQKPTRFFKDATSFGNAKVVFKMN